VNPDSTNRNLSEVLELQDLPSAPHTLIRHGLVLHRLAFQKLVWVSLPLLLSSCFGSSSSQAVKTLPALESERKTLSFEPSSENFANPERGFYQQENPLDLGEKRSPLGLEALKKLRGEGISTVRLYLLIDEFRDKTLSSDALEFIGTELAKLRTAGLKAIPRFAYNFPSGGNYPYQDPDATRPQVLAHIAQLEPILRENADVIAYLEMGFVGAWGEWHSSSNNLVDPEPNPKVNDASRALVNRLLEVLPKERMVAMRYPRYKQQLLGQNPLEPSEAYSGSARARMGAHNDCFLASNTDWGTYSGNPVEREATKTFLALDNRFLPQGGETCNANAEAQPYIGCANAQLELARLSYTSLNRGYLEAVYARWDQEGCLNEVKQKLGYRFRLLEARVPTTAARGSSLKLDLKMTNDGYARPYNPRQLELVLKNKASGKVVRLEVKPNVDVRLFLPGPAETKTLELSAVVPPSLELGNYSVLLNLPDPMPSLEGKAAFSIRLANVGVWDEVTGFNALNSALEVK
jgi:hypothetical protein